MNTLTAAARTSSDAFQLTKVPSFFTKYLSVAQYDALRRTLDRCSLLIQNQGTHSIIAMESVGFQYTDNGYEAFCDACGLQLPEYLLSIEPFSMHAQCSPTCSFVRSMLPVDQSIARSSLIPAVCTENGHSS